MCFCVFVFLVVRWGQGNMRDILFQHIPAGADLMTHDLKMYMRGEERGRVQGGRVAEEEEEEEESRGVLDREQNGWKLKQIKQKRDENVFCLMHCSLFLCPSSLFLSLEHVLVWPASCPSAWGAPPLTSLCLPLALFSLFWIHFFSLGWKITVNQSQDGDSRQTHDTQPTVDTSRGSKGETECFKVKGQRDSRRIRRQVKQVCTFDLHFLFF